MLYDMLFRPKPKSRMIMKKFNAQQQSVVVPINTDQAQLELQLYCLMSVTFLDACIPVSFQP